MKPLTKLQLEVLAELAEPNAKAHYMRYMGRFNPNPYYFLSGSHRHATAQIRALDKRGLLDTIEKTPFGDHSCVINAAGRKALSESVKAAKSA